MILDKPYDKELFDTFLKNFLPDYQKDERSVRTPDSSILTKVTQLGASRAVSVTVLEAECEETDSNKRIAITQAAFKVLRDHSIRNAIVAFHDGNDQWRLSLLTSTLEIKDGKVIKKDSNPRRYSYLLGVGAKTVTPYKYLVEKGAVEDIKQLQDRFSVEVVNKQFYASVAELFTKLVGGERGATKYPGLLKINSVISQNIEHQEFAVRLIGRIIFSWFLKEKKSAAGVPIVPYELLSLDAVASNADYYHSILEPLFFELLNKRVEHRHESLREAPFSTVPYLNGGLFSPQRSDFYNQNSFNGAGTPGLTHIPDGWFTELFTVLEQYNFTVDENTSYDVDLSIDPEMLGRIFENLLAEINPETGESARKSTGSFYTPREIVEYMVDSSLLEFLKSRTGTDEDKLRALISWGQEDDELHPLTDAEKEKVVNALADLTILDPACGSGAFPIGILQKVVYILQQVDEKAELWLRNQLKTISSPELRRDIEEKYRNENYDYLRKLGVIRESIFGVDIQTIATEISKLRCFLTLIIEENVDDDTQNRSIRPLPNLDFKFVTANSLISLPVSDDAKAQNIFEDATHIDRLKDVRNRYFGADADERSRLQVEFKDLQLTMFKSRLASMGATSDLYNVLSDWNPFNHEKTHWFDPEWMFGIEVFDIVVGNPPYVSTEKVQEPEKSVYKHQYVQVHAARTDIYTYFYARGLNLCRQGTGILCFITSNKWMLAAYGEKLRGLFSSKDPIKVADFGSFHVFETATVDTSIVLLKNTQNEHKLRAAQFKDDYKKDTPIQTYFDEHQVNIPNPSTEPWVIGSSVELELKAKIEKAGTALKNWNVKISYGIKTGLNEAFIIDESTRSALISRDPKSAEIIMPILSGRDIKRYGHTKNSSYVLLVGFGMYKELKDQYPSVFSHLHQYQAKLSARGQCKSSRTGKSINPDYPGQHHWLELDNNPSKDYFSGFDNEKISWGNLALSAQFSLIEEGYAVNAPSPILLSKDNIMYLLGVLNSKLGDYYIRLLGVTRNGGYFEYKPMFVQNLPIPQVNEGNARLVNDIEDKVRRIVDLKKTTQDSNTAHLEEEINKLVYELYKLAPEEIDIVEGLK